MAKLSDVQHKSLRNLLGTHSIGYWTLAINAGSAATIKTTNTNYFVINGIKYSKAALSAVALAADATQQALITGQSTFYVQPISTTVHYVIGIDSGGTVKCFQGTYADQSFTPFSSNLGTGDVPDIGDSYAPIGMIKVVTGSATFTPATTALDAANITFTFYDLERLPSTNP